MYRLDRRSALGWNAPVLTAALLVGLISAPAGAAVNASAAITGRWSAPFEEGGSGAPRCVDDGSGFTVCKPTAYAAAMLPDGRIYYYNGLESHQNQDGGTVPTVSPTARNSQSRILDISDGTPSWEKPSPERGGMYNPDIKEGTKDPYQDDPVAASGIPGRPGEGPVGSLAGRTGVIPSEEGPHPAPDDTAENDGDLFCGAIVSLADGRILLAGGTDWYNQPSVMDRNDGDPANVGVVELAGLRNTVVFDHTTDSYTQAGHMKYGRWYPTSVVLPDGKVITASGVQQLITNSQMGNVRRTETFDPATGQWTENYTGVQSEASLPLIARLVLAPNGKVFFSSVGQAFNPNGHDLEELMWNFQQYFDTHTSEWEMVGPAPLGFRSDAFQVALPMTAPYDEMTLVTGGGTLGPTPSTYVATPFVTKTVLTKNGDVTHSMLTPMNTPRWFGSGVPLPDGNILVLGGGDRDEVLDPGSGIPNKVPELYDVASDKWTPVAAHTRDKVYHHTAMLLPDMRVLLGGHSPIGAHYGGRNTDQSPVTTNNDNDPSFQIFDPPYLFRGERPVITRAPRGLAWGTDIEILTDTPPDQIENVILMRTTSIQHLTDGDQRTLVLPHQPTGDGRVAATVPPDGIAAPPGYYYLVVNKRSPDGAIPSVAVLVQVGSVSDDEPAAKPFPDDSAGVTGGSATPLDDSSYAARGQTQIAEAAEGTPAEPAGTALAGAVEPATPPGQPAQAASATPPGRPARVVSAAPATTDPPAAGLLAEPVRRRTAPLSGPALPVAVLAVAGGWRRWRWP